MIDENAPTAEVHAPDEPAAPIPESGAEPDSPVEDHATPAAPPAEELTAATAEAGGFEPPPAEPATSQPEEAPAPEMPAAKKPKKPKAAAVATDESEEAPPEHTAEPAPEQAADTDPAATEAAAQPAPEPVPENKKRWYAIKIQSGREESIKAAIERKVKIEGLEPFFGQIVIPVEELIVKKKVRVKNKKTGETTTQEKNVPKYNKKFPGYLFAEVEFNDEILYVFRETSGVGDFVGITAKKIQGTVTRTAPAPMTDEEVKSMLTGVPDPNRKKGDKRGKVVVKLDLEKGDKVRIRNGAFTGSEGEVKIISEPKDPATETPKITVEVTLWGRPVPVEVDYWEVDKI